MKRWLPAILVLAAVSVLILGYVDAYQVTLEALKEPGVMYCGFLPFGVLSDLLWMNKYLAHRIGSVILIMAAILLRLLNGRRKENADGKEAGLGTSLHSSWTAE